MDLRVRRVLARYFKEPEDISPDFEAPGECPPGMEKSWMEYLDDKSKTIDNPNSPVPDMLKGKKYLDTSFNTTNPYDYDSPSDKPKDQEDSSPFENVISDPTQFGYFNTPKVYSEGGVLEEWRKVREQDFTTDEDQQQPAISLTRKLSSEIIPEELLTSFTISGNEFNDFVLRSKVAASLDEIIAKDYHYKNDLKLQRASKCKAIWSNKNNPNQYEKGLFTFKVSSPGSRYGTHSVYLQFLRDDDKEATKYVDYPVHIGCTCPAFLYSGAQYYAVKDNYMYMPAFKPDLVAPKEPGQYTVSVSQRYPKGKRNPGRGKNARVCKHILAVFDEIKNTPIEVHYKNYPIYSPPSKKIDVDAWEKMMKFPFTEKDVKDRLLSSSPKVPGYFKRESFMPTVIDWFRNTWFPRTDEQKLKSLKEFSMFPERVFFILIEEAYLKRQSGGYISKRLVDEGFDLMDQVIDKDNPAEGQVIPELDDGTIGTGEVDVVNNEAPEDEGVESEKPNVQRTKKQYGVPSTIQKKVKNPERMKRPTTVRPAIK
jgi:hypothetical protein